MSDSALITGAGSGIGLASALVLAAKGFQVYASVPDLDQRPEVGQAAAGCGVKLRVLLLDVTDPGSVERAVDTVVEETGNVYGLVNSAGLGMRGFFEDLSDRDIRRLFDVNVFGVMAATRACFPICVPPVAAGL